MKQGKPYKTYTREFKQEAVRLMETTNRPATEAAMELGIRRNQLYKWEEQLAVKGDAAFSGGGRPRTRTCLSWHCSDERMSSSGRKMKS
jgi:transposase